MLMVKEMADSDDDVPAFNEYKEAPALPVSHVFQDEINPSNFHFPSTSVVDSLRDLVAAFSGSTNQNWLVMVSLLLLSILSTPLNPTTLAPMVLLLYLLMLLKLMKARTKTPIFILLSHSRI